VLETIIANTDEYVSKGVSEEVVKLTSTIRKSK
jgi:hypothetical protein